jgi:hypothetical protein
MQNQLVGGLCIRGAQQCEEHGNEYMNVSAPGDSQRFNMFS